MAEATTVIDIVAQVTDETARGANSAISNVTKLEKSMQNLSKQILGMKGKSKLEVKAELKDMASRGIQAVADKGKQIAGKVWTVTLKAVDLVTAPFKKIWSLVSNPLTQAAAFAGVSFGLADTMNTFKSFEQGMANVAAISGATGKDFEALNETAKHLGETTVFSASEAASAMENLAMAGHKTQDIIAEMPGLLDLAAAGSVDLGTASDVVASALAQFKLDASESTRVADVFAATATNSKTDVQGLGESFKYAGSLAGALGYNIEDVAVAFGIMGNSAIDASSAGTALRGMLARMSKQDGLTAEESNAVAEAMKKVGVSMTDEKGKSKSLLTVMTELRKGFSGMSEAEKSATAANLAGQNAMSGLLAIVNASDEDFDKLTKAIYESDGAAKAMADRKMSTFQGSLQELQSAAEGVKIAIGEKLEPYATGLVKWVTSHMPDIKNAVGSAVDFITGKIDDTKERLETLMNSPEWEHAETLWDKIGLAWDKLIAEPFDEWWNGSGKTWLAGKANEIGEGIGTALHDGLMGILGIDAGGAVSDGLEIGQSFADGFIKGFDGEEVGKALAEAIKGGMKAITADAATLLPGGEEASSTSGISAALLGLGAFKVGKAGYNLYKGGKALVNGTKAVGSAIGSVSGISTGLEVAKAAKTGGAAAQSALGMAKSGGLGLGAKIGAKAGTAGAKAIPIIGGIISALEMGVDAIHGVGKAEEWTGKSGTGAKVASGIGAALGGTGAGVTGNTSAVNKGLNIGGGALKGAGIGAAIGTLVAPGVGTAVGGAIGAGVGAIGAAIGGENIAKGLSAAGEAVGNFFTETLPTFVTETIPNAASAAGEKIGTFFNETVPQAFDGLMNDISTFFSETVPYAIGYAAGSIQVFFTETVPEFFGNLWDGITGFFTETVPTAIETAGEAIGLFFTETVPQFFSNLWDGIVGFFTETLPEGLETIGEALSTFFTETVPSKMEELWNGIVNFFTKEIPAAVASVGQGISGFFSGIKDAIGNFFSNIKSKVTSFISGAEASASAGYTAATKHADGGIMTSPHLGMVAEDGAEAIIPLSGKRRKRGLALWEQAGQLLGVNAYAEGGIAGEPEEAPEPLPEEAPEPLPEKGGGNSQPTVTIGNVTFEVNIDGADAQDPQSLVAAIRENIRGMTDEIAYQLATALQQTYANTPKTAW